MHRFTATSLASVATGVVVAVVVVRMHIAGAL